MILEGTRKTVEEHLASHRSPRAWELKSPVFAPQVLVRQHRQVIREGSSHHDIASREIFAAHVNEVLQDR
jgi:hypothetical protein